MSLFEALFNGVSTRFRLRYIEKYFEKTRLIERFVQPIENLRLGSIKFESHCDDSMLLCDGRIKMAQLQGQLLNEETDHT